MNKILVKSVKLTKFAAKPVKKYLFKNGFRTKAEYASFLRSEKVNENMVLYESYHGKSFTCNPYAIFKKLQTNPKYKNFIHVWAVDSLDNEAIKKMGQYKNVRFVKIHSKEYRKTLAQAKYLINNTSFPYYFQKGEKQIYINTWHGTPLKTLGLDTKNAGFSTHSNIQRNFLHTDYLISPNQFTYEKLLGSHDILGIFNGSVLDTGYPRNDSMFEADSEKMKETLNISKHKKVILYAPTWRGDSESSAQVTSEEMFNDVQSIRNRFSDEYEVILKVHYFVYKKFEENGLKSICVPNWIDTNELLSCVDVLITDYSSILFDFAPQKKPILFYMNDLETYGNERGLYLNPETLPGAICTTIDELVTELGAISTDERNEHENYEVFLNEFNYNDDGKATERLIDVVFEGKHEELKIKTANAKEKLLIYCGGFYNNGITVSAINLSKYINHDKYDVTIIDFSKKKQEQIDNINKLDPRVRKIFRIGTWNMTIADFYKHNLVLNKGFYSEAVSRLTPEDMYASEMKRILGDTSFDYVIDFGGYNKLWSKLLLSTNAKTKSIFLHNNMYEESKKMINGKNKHGRNLKVIFSLYKYYDKIVSVSKSVMEENLDKLGQYVPNAKEKMVYINNSIDYKRVVESKDEKRTIELNDTQYLLKEESFAQGSFSMAGVPMPKEDEITFINVGRLSPEKGQDKLITAFSTLSKKHDNLKLLIMGEGPLRRDLEKLIHSLQLEDKVFLVGQWNNPYSLINQCDCFVLSSNHEGQGLVLLETLIMEKPIISTDIPGPHSVLEDGYGRLVNNDEESLTVAMSEFIEDKNKFTNNLKKFDYEKYNEDAMALFYKTVCK